MKVFIIKNKISEDVYVVKNKLNFCKQHNLTPRLLDYTIKGASSTRYQPWHKNYQIVEKINFIESINGDTYLWDNGVLGYCKRDDGTSIIYKDSVNNSELEKENDFLQKELKKTLKQKQKLQDLLNLNRKLGREQYRYENFIDVLKDTFKDLIKSNVPKYRKPLVERNTDNIAVLTLSDWHIGEKVDEVNNYFDSDIARIRAEIIFNKFEEEIKMREIDEIYILMLGDFIFAQSIINRPDMKLSSEFPEVQSAIECFKILASLIDRLAEKYKITLAGVIGNESRFSNHMAISTLKNEASNNLDTLIFEMLRQRYLHNRNITFIGGCDEIESVVEVGETKFLITHGHSKNINHKELDKSFINIKARLEPIYGQIDYMALGHIHSTLIMDRVFRNSSLVGSNSYSNDLGFAKSFVAQNMFIIEGEKIKAMSIGV